MFNTAYIFPGQGAQYVGMGEDFYREYPQAREVFAAADQLLGFNLSELIFKGPIDQLTRTINCQTAIFTVSIACLRVLQAKHPGIKVKYAAGLSLGEYSALVAAEALDFESGLSLVRKRAQYMEEAAEKNPGGMISIIGLSLDTAEEICRQADVEVANLNCPGQIVISGSRLNLEKAKEIAKMSGAKKVIPLKVAGAFHSSLMEPASQGLSQSLEEVTISAPKIPVVSNVTANIEDSPQEIKDNLVRQLRMRTRWEDSVKLISSCGVKDFLEIGPGKILKGLLRRIDSDLRVYNIETVNDLESFRRDGAPCC